MSSNHKSPSHKKVIQNSSAINEKTNIQSELREYIKKYVSYDNFLKQQNQKLAEIREKKKSAEEHILYTIKTYNLEDIEINLPDGNLAYNERDSYSPLSISFLKQALINYYSSNPKHQKDNSQAIGIEAVRKAEEMLDYILSQREVKKVSGLKRSFRR